ncbi:MAG: leucine-rich repeat domain-containing protein [Crocinitomicaceae bacterium]|nr:leucine-rich repeat domain-containing protein [Crocinitomicaceae bacterium]
MKSYFFIPFIAIFIFLASSCEGILGEEEVPLTLMDISFEKHLTITDTVLKHKKLETLIGRNCQLKNVPNRIDELRSLKTLKLPQNDLYFLPKSMRGLWELTKLDLDTNQFSSIDYSLGRLPNLEYLELSHNRFKSFPHELLYLKKLKSLDISLNEISKFDANLSGMQKLETLNFRNCKLTTFLIGSNSPHGLMNLELSNNDINNKGFGFSPDKFPRLTSVRLAWNDLDYIPKELLELKFLNILDLGYNNLSSLPEGLLKLSSLKSLNLKYNKFKSIPSVLYSITGLDYLNIQGIKVSKEDIKQLKKLNPNATIFYDR